MKRLSAFILVLILCFTVIFPSALAASANRDTRAEEQLALDLKDLGLFRGVSSTDFALDRAPTRVEAVVMLVRSLGQESEALAGSWPDPFTDIPSWASKYIGYAYQKSLTNGVSATEFGTGSASANMYVTFALRALGYSDQNGDFSWDQPFSLAKSIGILPDIVQTTDFLRADVVAVTYASLSAKIKGSTSTLSDKLISDGVFTGDQFETYYDASAIVNAGSDIVLTPVEIYAKCSPAVFYLEVYNSKGVLAGSASGFFIDGNGTAVTNYHAIKGACSAKITTADTNTVYNVVGVYDYNVDEDWAVIKINGSGFSHLGLGDSSGVVGGEASYAIGNPLGLKNTISEGIVSNPSRQISNSGVTFIQTTAAISQGSSGGALLNEYGKVVGITSETASSGQNINLAVPINLIKNYRLTGCSTLLSLTMNAKSVIAPYAAFPGVPDCGAYSGIALYKSYSTGINATYYYTADALTSAGAWGQKGSLAYPKYLDELTDWGFTYINEFQAGSGTYWQFSYSSDTAAYVVLVGTTTLDGVSCLSVQVSKA